MCVRFVDCNYFCRNKYFKEYYKVCYKFIDIMVFIFYLEIVNKYILNN